MSTPEIHRYPQPGGFWCTLALLLSSAWMFYLFFYIFAPSLHELWLFFPAPAIGSVMESNCTMSGTGPVVRTGSHLFCSSFSFSPCNKYLEDRNSVSQQVVPSLTTLVCRCEVQFAIFSCSALRKPWNIQNFLDVAVVFLDANICPAATMTHGFKFPARTQKEMSLDWEDLSKALWDGSKGACVINLGGWNNDQSTPSPLGCVKEHSWDPGWALKLLLSWTLLERKRCEVSDSSRHHLRLGLLVCDPCAGWPHWTGDSGVWLNKGINLSHFAYFPFPSTPPDQCKDLVLNSLPHPSGQSELIPVQPQGTWGTISTGTIPLLCNLCANAL